MRKHALAGFTLTELMVSVSILAIAATSAAPSMTAFVASQRVKSVASDLYSDLQRARSEAIKRNASVVLAPSGAWAEGWQITAESAVLGVQGPAARVTVSGPSSVTYGGLGRTTAAQLAFSVAAPGTTTTRCVRVSLSGQPSVATGSCT